MQWHPGEKNKEKSSIPYKAPVNNNENNGVKTYTKVPPPRRLTPTEMVRKKQNLCFNCDEIYHVGHKYKKTFVILVEDDLDTDGDDLIYDESTEEKEEMWLH